MYGGLGGFIDGNINDKQKEIDKLVAAKEQKVDPGVDVIGSIAGTILPKSWIDKRNETPTWALGLGDSALLFGAGTLGSGHLAALGPLGKKLRPKWLGGKDVSWRTIGKEMGRGVGEVMFNRKRLFRRGGVALGLGIANAIVKGLTGGAPEPTQQGGE